MISQLGHDLISLKKEVIELKKKVKHQGEIISVLNTELETHLIKRDYCPHKGK